MATQKIKLLLTLFVLTASLIVKAQEEEKLIQQKKITTLPVDENFLKSIDIQEINFLVALDMLYHYKGKRLNNITARNAIPHNLKDSDSYCMWLSVGDLKKLADEIGKVNGDGLRLYFATYPNITSQTDLPPNTSADKIRNHLTIVFVPTVMKDSVTHEDALFTIKDTVKGKIIQKPFLLSGTYNHGGICPPPSSCQGILFAEIAYKLGRHLKYDY